MKRRDFLSRTLAASAGVASVPLVLGGIPVHAGTRHAMSPEWLANDNVLVLVQLFGGNDGLNTFVPYTDARYYQRRPTVGIPSTQVLKIANPTMGFHPQLTGFRTLFTSGALAVVQGVGYEGANRSHFRSTDIWLSASGAQTVLETGWLGRYLEYAHPTYPLELPPDPFAVQIGGSLSMMLQSDKGAMGITLADPDTFFRLGRNQLDEPVDDGIPYGSEYMFIRAIKEQSDTYSQRVKTAFDGGRNIGTYPTTSLGQQLKLVARLIAGGLKSKIFMTYLGGFDTHVNQLTSHAALLKQLGDATAAFVGDLRSQGIGQNVIGLTISEFGRRTRENGSAGTDHGTSAAQFLFGEPVNSGVLGADPDFDVTDSSGDLLHTFEYRQIYSELLEHWFAVPKDDVTQLLGGRFIPLPLIRSVTGAERPSEAALAAISEFQLAQNHPNPFHAEAGTTISYRLGAATTVELAVFDSRGARVATLAQGMQAAGAHSVRFGGRGLPPGAYFMRLVVGGQSVSRRMLVLA